jgi:hypothetical protein
MHRIVTTAITGTITATALTAVAVATPSLADASGAGTRHSTLTLRLHPHGGGQLDLGAKGLSLGDEFFEHGTVTGDAQGHYLRSGSLIAMPHGSTPPQESQHFSLRLGHGTIEAVGQHAAVNRFTVAVIGGTGAWRGATGTLHIGHGRLEVDLTR